MRKKYWYRKDHSENGLIQLVAKRIRDFRKVEDLTQKELADKIGIDYSTIGMAERGQMNLSLDYISKIADGLSVEPYKLLYQDTKKRRSKD